MKGMKDDSEIFLSFLCLVNQKNGDAVNKNKEALRGSPDEIGRNETNSVLNILMYRYQKSFPLPIRKL